MTCSAWRAPWTSLGSLAARLLSASLQAQLQGRSGQQGVQDYSLIGKLIVEQHGGRDPCRGVTMATIRRQLPAHTIHFVERFDVSEWLLIITEATEAGSGRVCGGGRIYSGSGVLVGTFHQDSMARTTTGEADARSSL
jgi:Thioesterase-like superfamily